jgi:hypothetical protein
MPSGKTWRKSADVRRGCGSSGRGSTGDEEETARELASHEFANGYRSMSGPVRSRLSTARDGNCIPGSSRCLSF